MITGDTDPKLLSVAFGAGANYFVSKPLCKKKLERVISAAQCVIQKEKRRYQRIPAERPATISSGHQQFKGQTVDVSMGGLMVRTEDVYPVGTRVEIEMRVYPGAQPFRAKGRVVRLLEINLMGIEFETLEIRESEKLQDFLLPFLLNQFEGITDNATPRAAVA
jgi:c-di-GMP-binding flagellar brake protein YcgR